MSNANTEKLLKRKRFGFVKKSLRSQSLKWPERNEALKAARVERGLYRCKMCQETFKRQEVQLDHINPIIPVDKGFTTWDDYIERLFCSADRLQVLCKQCHEVKTLSEDLLRPSKKKKGV